MDLIRIPRSFFDDHEARGLDTPKIQGQNKRFVWVDRKDESFDELVTDAEYYTDPYGPDDCPEMVSAARRLLITIAKQGGA
ncbi:MAG: hypothetical protein KAJ55_00430 [Anaerolineales bacterium]|nr:hypothetical protein [Anaerolineales bacterium]